MAKLPSWALVELYRSSGSELKGFLRRRLRSEHEAEDLAQEAFLRLHHAQVDAPIEQPRSFLFRVARNLLIDRQRRPRREQLSFDDPQVDELLHDVSALPDQVLQSQQWVAAYQRALDRMTPKCRAVFVQCRMEGHSHARIADDLGISKKMVEKYMTQALAQLREALSEFFEPGTDGGVR